MAVKMTKFRGEKSLNTTHFDFILY